MDKIMEIALLAVLIILVVALFVISFLRRRKFDSSLNAMREELKNGDKVMTDCGIVGEIVDSFVEDETKYFVLKTGKDDKIGYLTVHGAAVYHAFGKEQASNEEKKVVVIKPKTEQTENK